jgi:hypothetical protein
MVHLFPAISHLWFGITAGMIAVLRTGFETSEDRAAINDLAEILDDFFADMVSLH